MSPSLSAQISRYVVSVTPPPTPTMRSIDLPPVGSSASAHGSHPDGIYKLLLLGHREQYLYDLSRPTADTITPNCSLYNQLASESATDPPLPSVTIDCRPQLDHIFTISPSSNSSAFVTALDVIQGLHRAFQADVEIGDLEGIHIFGGIHREGPVFKLALRSQG